MKEIVVLSGKGGTGKTSISAAFATLSKSAIIADCDVDAANLYLLLQPQNFSEHIYVSGQKAKIKEDICINCGKCITYCRFDAISMLGDHTRVSETACEGCLLCARVCPVDAVEFFPNDKSRWYEGKLPNGLMVHARLAPGEENSGKLVSVVREQARKLAKQENIETILLDGPPGIGCPAIASLTGVDKALIVTEPTNSGFHDLKRITALAKNFKVNTFVIVNKYDLNADICQSIENWCLSEGITFMGKLPFDKQVVEAMVQCKNIVEFNPTSEISKTITYIFNKLMQDE